MFARMHITRKFAPVEAGNCREGIAILPILEVA
jgi:hypothetical protein